MYKGCTHAPVSVAETEDGIEYFCADRNGVMDFNGDLIINLTGIPNFPDANSIPKELLEHINNSKIEIVIPWPDFGVPNVKNTFWPALHEYVLNNKYKKVCIHCEGGHGRTGTAMSAILIAVFGWNITAAVEYVRKYYCEDAVETEEQVLYLRELDNSLNNSNVADKDIPTAAMHSGLDVDEANDLEEMFSTYEDVDNIRRNPED